MLDLLGEPVLVRDVNRLGRSQLLSEIVIATTILPADDPIASLCRDRGWSCFRGDEGDLLDRYYRAAQAYNADVIVRITSDCPMIDPEVVDVVIRTFLDLPHADYVSNTLPPRTFPRGLDTEVMTSEALARAWREDRDPKLREHVTPYIYRNPDIFRIHGVFNDKDLSFHRWTLDTPEDLAFIRAVYAHFGDDHFTWMDVLEYLDKRPEVVNINRDVQQKEISRRIGYGSHETESKSMSNQFKTEQESFWAGEFGTEYITRNQGPELLASNLAFFNQALRSIRKPKDCIEFGANVGMNLKALKLLYPQQEQFAIEINADAAEELRTILPPENVFHTSILDYSAVQQFDLVLIKGVLIHISPDYLSQAYEILYQSTGRYLLICEYYNPVPVQIPYRGHSGRLFKRDFCGEILDHYPDLKLIDYGFAYHRDPSFPQDDITWFLLERRD